MCCGHPVLSGDICEVCKGFFNPDHVVGSVADLARGILDIPEVGLCLDKNLLKSVSGICCVIAHFPCLKISLILPHIGDEAVRDAHKLYFCEGLVLCCHKMCALIEPLDEDLDRFLGVVF